MNRQEETAVVHAWEAWRRGRTLRDEEYLEFFDEQIRGNPRYRGVQVFEVLDVLLNAAQPVPTPNRRESA